MAHRSATALIACFAIAVQLQAEDITSKEFSFSISVPTKGDWQLATNGIVGERNRSHLAVVANKPEQRSLMFLAAPRGKQATSGKEIKTLGDMKEGWERGFLKKADKKVSSMELKVSGQDAYQVVALKKLPTGEDRHIVGIIVVANGWSYSFGGVTKVPWDKDPDLLAFIDSVRFNSPADP